LGSGRIGFDFIKLFKQEEMKFLVVEHDPEAIAELINEKIPHQYGDASDPDLLDDLKISQAELVVSTIPDLETNLIILSCAKRNKDAPLVMVVAHRITNALELYKAGADYVVLPHFLGSTHATSLIQRFTKDATEIQSIRNKHIAHLEDRVGHGHEHPEVDRLR
jgi:Trk K+ transport system NAD-binding subunit